MEAGSDLSFFSSQFIDLGSSNSSNAFNRNISSDPRTSSMTESVVQISQQCSSVPGTLDFVERSAGVWDIA